MTASASDVFSNPNQEECITLSSDYCTMSSWGSSTATINTCQAAECSTVSSDYVSMKSKHSLTNTVIANPEYESSACEHEPMYVTPLH